jgi:acyl-CoA thioester hydrolase
MKGALPDFEPQFRWEVRVYWEDTDGGGVVYHANYLKFLERARTEWLRSHDFTQSDLARSDGIGFVVRALTLEFLGPARLDDELQVVLWLVRTGASVVELRQAVERRAERLLQADVKLACVKLDSFLPARLPPVLRTALAARSSERPQIK